MTERQTKGVNDYGGVSRFDGDRYTRDDREHRGGRHFAGERNRRSKGAKGGRHFAGERYRDRDRHDEKQDKKKGKDKKGR